MAVLLKRKRLFNPSKKLSLKQKLFFGSKRQRAAAKEAMRNSGKKRWPRRKKVSPLVRFRTIGRNPKRRRKNIGEIITLDLRSNPGRKRRKKNIMTRRRVRRANPHRRVSRRRRNAPRSWSKLYRKHYRINPRRRRRKHHANPRRRRNYSRRRNPSMRRRRNYSRRRRNPGMAAVSKALGVAVGAVVNNFVMTQVSSMAPNLASGPMYYATGAVAALAEGWIVSKILKKPALGEDIAIGGLVLIALKAIGNYFPQYGVGLSGVNRRGLGLLGKSSFTYPQVPAGPGKYGTFLLAPDYQNAINAAATAASSKSGMGAVFPMHSGGGRTSLTRVGRLS